MIGDLRGSTPGVPDDEEYKALRRLRAERRLGQETAASRESDATEEPPRGRETAA